MECFDETAGRSKHSIDLASMCGDCRLVRGLHVYLYPVEIRPGGTFILSALWIPGNDRMAVRRLRDAESDSRAGAWRMAGGTAL